MNNASEAGPILDLIEGFRRSKTMFAAVQLGIFDSLVESPQTSAQLAQSLGLNQPAAERLLTGCIALGLLASRGSEYELTEVARRFLTSTSADTLAGYINYSNDSLYPLWARLENAVRLGSNRWGEVFGSRHALFDHYFRDERAAASFLSGMHGLGQLASPHVASAFDLSGFSRLVDLGGATGHLCIAACEVWPHLQATILDLPAVEKLALDYVHASAFSGRIRFQAGDFFSEALPPADLYVLGRILHDWTDEKIARLLDKIVASLPAAGGLLIAETFLNDAKTGPVYSAMQDLNMLVCTEGRERNCSEYEVLLRNAGFASVKFRRTGTVVDAMLAIKG